MTAMACNSAPTPTHLAATIGDVARARGTTQLAKVTGLSRESLYKSLSGKRAPNSDTLYSATTAPGGTDSSRW
jgi:probable addiction module antidote protein